MSKEEQGTKKKNRNIYTMVMISIMAAIICVLGPWSIAIGPVPIAFANLAIFIAIYVLGWKGGTVSCLLYILLGLIGVPVFSGFSAGIGKVLGPTGGYIIGYIPMAVIAGIFVEKFEKRLIHLLGMLLGTAVCYLLGTAWFCVVMDTTVGAAMGLCVIPFIPGDIIKMIIAMLLGPLLRKRLSRVN